MISEELMQILACPDCEGTIVAERSDLRCEGCGAGYPVEDGIPVMLGTGEVCSEQAVAESRQWDNQATIYEAARSPDIVYQAAVDAAVRHLAVRAGQRVLDAGCGTGLTVRQYQHIEGLTTVALDVSRKSLHELQRKLPRKHSTHVVCGDFTRLPFRRSVFDRVLCANSVQHLRDESSRNAAFAHFSRVARDQGRIVVSVHNFSRPKRWAGWQREGSSGGHSGRVEWIHRFETREFEALIARHLKVVKVVGCGLPLPYRFKLTPVMKLAEAVLSRSNLSAPWGHMLVGVGQKASQVPCPCPDESTKRGGK